MKCRRSETRAVVSYTEEWATILLIIMAFGSTRLEATAYTIRPENGCMKFEGIIFTAHLVRGNMKFAGNGFMIQLVTVSEGTIEKVLFLLNTISKEKEKCCLNFLDSWHLEKTTLNALNAVAMKSINKIIFGIVTDAGMSGNSQV